MPNSKSLAVIDELPTIKSVLAEAKSLKEFEAYLRDYRDFTRTEATALVSGIKSLLQSESAAEDQTAVIAGLFQQFKTPQP